MALATHDRRAIGVLNVALGAWLFLSAFLWPHTRPQFYNAWMVGALAIVIALASFRSPGARWANTALGLWLFVSAWLIPTASEATSYNHLIGGAALVAMSLIPGHVGRGAAGARRP